MGFSVRSIFDFWSQVQLFGVCMPYYLREYNRKNNKLGNMRILKEDDPDLPNSIEGKVCVITGGTRGIGAEVVKALLRKNCHVITGTSSSNQSEIDSRYKKIMADVPNDTKGKLEIWHLNLLSMESVMEFINRFNQTKLPLNYLIANAGVMLVPYKLSEQRFESHYAINYLSHCVLVLNLLSNLLETGKQTDTESRIVLVSSCAHFAAKMRFNDLNGNNLYSASYAYSQSKLAQLLFAYKLSRTLQNKSDWSRYVKVFALHPGMASTDLYANVDFLKLFPQVEAILTYRTPKEGAETVLYGTLSSELKGLTGKYLEDSRMATSSSGSQNESDQDKLWKVTLNTLTPWIEEDMFN